MDAYRLVFWFNTLSPHQLPYIKHLIADVRVKEVILNVGEYVSPERASMGWEDVGVQGIVVNLKPNKVLTNQLFACDENNSIHFFSGIRGFAFVFECFKESLKYKIKRGLITEAPFTYAFGRSGGKPLFLHKLRFLIQDRQFVSSIDYVYAIGEKSQLYYRALSKTWKVIPFIYCTETPAIKNYEPNDRLRFIFVGNLSPRKSCKTLIEASGLLNKDAKTEDFSLTIIGGGGEEKMLQNLVKRLHVKNIHFTGAKKMGEVPSFLADADVLVLPSLLDGWGAVINEALSMGLFVICSDQCGAKDLLQNENNGLIFKAKSEKELSLKMKWCIQNKKQIKYSRKAIMQWSEQAIGGKSLANYFVDSLTKRISSPWKKQFKNFGL